MPCNGNNYFRVSSIAIMQPITSTVLSLTSGGLSKNNLLKMALFAKFRNQEQSVRVKEFEKLQRLLPFILPEFSSHCYLLRLSLENALLTLDFSTELLPVSHLVER